MALQDSQARELVLAHNEQAYVQDDNKGDIAALVGPFNKKLDPNEKPVIFDEVNGKFVRTDSVEQAKRLWPFAQEGSYIVLANPARDTNQAHPSTASSNKLPAIEWGRKIILPGPVTFPLWPGQIAKVIPGHRLDANQYLIVSIYNEEEARNNWAKSVVKRVEKKVDGEGEKTESVNTETAPSDLTIGKRYVIKGTDVSFYIPPTGVEVVPDKNGTHVRDAVLLGPMEWCALDDQNGTTRYEYGEKVVFPSATENFQEKDGNRKFKAIELNDDMGVHVKVVKNYDEGEGEDKKTVKAGTELWITGKQQSIYFPRPEHQLIRYGSNQNDPRQFGITIPEGSAKYVLNKREGRINTVKGSQILLPDPRYEVIVRRVLDPKTVALWFPGSSEAQAFNENLRRLSEGDTGYVTDELARKGFAAQPASARMRSASSDYAGEQLDRGSKFTPPRTITVDDIFGAVRIAPYSGYAVQVVSKTGKRRVVQAPEAAILEFDEDLEVLELSTGTPKSDEKLIKTVYLITHNNKVSDLVDAETLDMVPVKIPLAYRVSFEGDPGKWFSVSNYVKLLTEHMRSVIYSIVKHCGIEDLRLRSAAIIRDTVLGPHPETGERRGKVFAENGMRIYEIEVGKVAIGNTQIAAMLENAQLDAVKKAIEVGSKQRELDTVMRVEAINQQIKDAQTITVLHTAEQDAKVATTQAELVAETARKKIETEAETVRRKNDADAATAQRKVISDAATALAQVKAETEKLSQNLKLGLERIAAESLQAAERNKAALAQAQAETQNAEERRKVEQANADLEYANGVRDQKLKVEFLEAEAKAFVDRIKALGPEFAAALQTLGDKIVAEKVAEAFGPIAAAEQGNVSRVVERFFGPNAPVTKMIEAAVAHNGNK